MTNLSIFKDKTQDNKTRLDNQPNPITDTDNATVDVLHNVMLDTDDEYSIRLQASKLIAIIGTDYAITVIKDTFLHHDDQAIRRLANIAMNQFDKSSSTKYFTLILHDDQLSSKERERAAKKLIDLNGDDALAEIQLIIHSLWLYEDPPKWLNHLIPAINGLKSDASSAFILNWAKVAAYDDRLLPRTREWAIKWLAKIANPDTEDILIGLLDNVDAQAKESGGSRWDNHAIEGLLTIGTPSALDVVEKWKQQNDLSDYHNNGKRKPRFFPSYITITDYKNILFRTTLVIETDKPLSEIESVLDTNFSWSKPLTNSWISKDSLYTVDEAVHFKGSYRKRTTTRRKYMVEKYTTVDETSLLVANFQKQGEHVQGVINVTIQPTLRLVLIIGLVFFSVGLISALWVQLSSEVIMPTIGIAVVLYLLFAVFICVRAILNKRLLLKRIILSILDKFQGSYGINEERGKRWQDFDHDSFIANGGFKI